ncbi:MAG: tryptophan 2,3-dioxygenase family protein [Planctomycetes bacterium]|nr:tryptophan 2,3-dioxygenase family protein [Planctomycetota bacterium]NUQ35474.1 hypothetical protein [Planctomycetaceae bacterium]
MGRIFGDGSTDYEKYVRSADLYRLTRDKEQWMNEDENLFQVTHMSMELWLSTVIQHVDQGVVWMNENKPLQAARMLKRGADIVDFLISSLRFLEQMSPWNYHQIRVNLGRGSGQQSPTFSHLLEIGKPVLAAYEALLKRRGLTVDDIQQNPVTHDDLYQLTSAMMTYDENFMRWRYAHFQLVKRIIGDKVLSLKGVPATALQDGTERKLFPELWECISRTTEVYNARHGAPGNSGYIIPKPKK